MKLFVLFGFAILHAGGSLAASFDCGAAGTPVEKLICSDAALSKLDEELGAGYKKALAAMDAGNRDKLLAEQKSWLRNSRSVCDDVACLRQSYANRIKLMAACGSMCTDFSEAFALDGEQYNLATLRDANQHNRSFSQDLRSRKLGEVLACTTLVDVAVGTAHGNHSYGGLCKLKGDGHAALSMVCNDDMLGHFMLAKGGRGTSSDELAAFTIKHCYGG